MEQEHEIIRNSDIKEAEDIDQPHHNLSDVQLQTSEVSELNQNISYNSVLMKGSEVHKLKDSIRALNETHLQTLT